MTWNFYLLNASVALLFLAFLLQLLRDLKKANKELKSVRGMVDDQSLRGRILEEGIAALMARPKPDKILERLRLNLKPDVQIYSGPEGYVAYHYEGYLSIYDIEGNRILNGSIISDDWSKRS